ncbi:MAG: transcription antitermination protein NusB [Candidatus Caenarcaniphilales bacterium]|nr:transcription antitermination protein NusB [Candidatus Caenarcaniphilales bacterium]
MNTRSAGRELAFLALGQLTQSNNLVNPDELILAATRTLRDFGKQQIKEVQKQLKELGENFFNQNLNRQSGEQISLEELQEQVSKLELACFTIKESLDLPELLNHEKDAFNFARELIQLFRANRSKIDFTIESLLEKPRDLKKNWSLHRILTTERTILRLAVSEILFRPASPAVVVIDEAVTLANKYGSPDSVKFVNGILADLLPESSESQN